MIDNQIESDKLKVHFLNLIVELWSLQDFQSVSENVQDFISLYLSVPTLDQRFYTVREFIDSIKILAV